MKVRIVLFCLSLFFFSATASADQANSVAGAEVYSAMSLIAEEGEFYGVQIILIPFGNGNKVLWREGDGQLAPPILLDPVRTKEGFCVTVPDAYQQFGVWNLKVDGSMIHADGPRSLHFDLKKLSVQ